MTVRIDSSAGPHADGAREAVRDGYVSGGTRRDLDRVTPHSRWSDALGEADRLLPADAQTSGGLLAAGEPPGVPVVGELVPAQDTALVIG